MNNLRAISYKKIIGIVFLVAWIIFSALYIINDKRKDFRTVQMQQAYQQGYTEGVTNSVRTLMTESSKCSPVPLVDGDKTVEVVAVPCLQKEQNSAEKK